MPAVTASEGAWRGQRESNADSVSPESKQAKRHGDGGIQHEPDDDEETEEAEGLEPATTIRWCLVELHGFPFVTAWPHLSKASVPA